MKFINVVTSLSLFCLFVMFSRIDACIYRPAVLGDLPRIIALEQAVAEGDLDRVLFLPQPYQTQSLEHAIQKNRIFIAVDEKTGIVVAQLKLFIINDPDEQIEVLDSELRCMGCDRQCVEICRDDFDYAPQNTVYLYLGAAFTHPAYRRHGIMGDLESAAYGYLSDSVFTFVREHKKNKLALCLGLVDANLPLLPSHKSRFLLFAQVISCMLHQEPNGSIHCFAYHAIKPTFMIKKGCLVKLPDNPKDHGLGCILEYQIA